MKIKRADLERILILCAAALVVVLALRGGANQGTTEYVYAQDTSLVAREDSTATGAKTETMTTVVFYQDGDGYLVPVTRTIEKTDGVAKATLSLMVKSPENDLAAARMGLRTVIPEGTTFDLDISDGKARVDMSKAALSCQSAEEETLMVEAVASTLTCFSSVQQVSFLFDGQKRSKLTYGTDVSGAFTGNTLNLEGVATANLAGAATVQLYFPSETGRLLVPVTRTVFSTADLTTAVLELCKGPRDDSGLERALPGGCGLNGVTFKDGVATVDFTSEFLQVTAQDDSAKKAVRAILYTCAQFPGVRKVSILVDGQKYTPPEDDKATFINDETEVIAQYPGVVEMD